MPRHTTAFLRVTIIGATVGPMTSCTLTTTPEVTAEFHALRNSLALYPESELFLLSAYQDQSPTSPHPTNIAIFECIYLTPQHIAFAIFLATKYSIDVIGFTILGDNDDESFFVAEDDPFFDFHFPRPFGPGLPFIAEPKSTGTFADSMLGRVPFHANRSVDCSSDCAVDVYGATGRPGASFILCPSHSNPSCFTPLCVSTPTTHLCTPRVIPPTHTPCLRLWDHFIHSAWISEWPDFTAEAHWTNALELARRPAPVLPAAAQVQLVKTPFKLRASAAAWFPRRKRTRRPCHSRPPPDPKGGRRTPPAAALYDLAQIAHAYRQAAPKAASTQAPKDTLLLRPPAQHKPKIITRRPAVLSSPTAPTRRTIKALPRPPTDYVRSVPSRCDAFIYFLATICVAM